MMTMARERLQILDDDTISCFEDLVISMFGESTEDFIRFTDSILHKAILPCLTRFLAMGEFSNPLPTRSSFASLTLAMISSSSDKICPLCSPRESLVMIDELRNSMDVCGKFIFQEHITEYHSGLSDKSKQDEETRNYTTLSTEVLQQIVLIPESLGLSEVAERSRAIGVYHADWTSWETSRLHLEDLDCLSRTPFHRILDGDFVEHHKLLHDLEYYESFWNNFNVWNSQDILGRTPLHILCQFEENIVLSKLVQKVLKAGAISGIATAYGTTPLHYAAAKGFAGICTLLIQYGAKSDMQAEDHEGRTALDHATIKKHDFVVILLKTYYKDAGLNEEMAKADGIAAAMKKGTYDG